MNAQAYEHIDQPYSQLFDWPPAPLVALPEHPMSRPPAFEPEQAQHHHHHHHHPHQHAYAPPAATDARGGSPVSASGASSPWSTASFPTQDVLAHPELDIAKFNRGSRGSMGSLALPSMHSSHHAPSGARAYTPAALGRPHSVAYSHVEPKEENPWNLVSWQPFNQDASGAAAFFLRSPTPTKRQRTNQACEKCRERKAKCNGARPTCQRCQARGHICEYAKERRMRGPNKTGRRTSQADMDDSVDYLAGNPSENATHNRADSPASSSSRRSSSEIAQDPPSSEQSKLAQPGTSHQASRARRSDSDSPASQASVLPPSPPTYRERNVATTRTGIALPTLSNGNLNLHYATSSRASHQRATSSESALRYAQSMPQIGNRYAQDAFLHEAQPASVWNPTLDASHMADHTPSHSGIGNNDESHSPPVDYPLQEIQTIHYSLSDVSSSSTPITPERFEHAWTSNDPATQQGTFQFAHQDGKPTSMLPTLLEFDGEAPLRDWTETHADDQPVIMAFSDQRNALAQ